MIKVIRVETISHFSLSLHVSTWPSSSTVICIRHVSHMSHTCQTTCPRSHGLPKTQNDLYIMKHRSEQMQKIKPVRVSKICVMHETTNPDNNKAPFAENGTSKTLSPTLPHHHQRRQPDFTPRLPNPLAIELLSNGGSECFVTSTMQHVTVHRESSSISMAAATTA